MRSGASSVPRRSRTWRSSSPATSPPRSRARRSWPTAGSPAGSGSRGCRRTAASVQPRAGIAGARASWYQGPQYGDRSPHGDGGLAGEGDAPRAAQPARDPARPHGVRHRRDRRALADHALAGRSADLRGRRRARPRQLPGLRSGEGPLSGPPRRAGAGADRAAGPVLRPGVPLRPARPASVLGGGARARRGRDDEPGGHERRRRRPARRPRPPAHGVQLAGAVVAALREVPAPHHAAPGPARARARGPRPRLRAAGSGGRAHRSAAHAGRPRGAGGRLARQGEPLRGGSAPSREARGVGAPPHPHPPLRAPLSVPSGTRDALLVCRSAPRRVPAPRSAWYMTVPMEDITQELTNLVARTLKVSPDQLRPEADLVTDLGADSLAVVELMMALEERLGVRIDDDEAEGLRTFGDALSLVRAKLAA